MNVDKFELKFPNFQADFGYKMDGEIDDVDIENLTLNDINLDEIVETAKKSPSMQTRYYVQLSWKSLTVGTYPCSETEYSSQIVPQQVITAAQNYKPPVNTDDIWIVVQETQEEGFYFLFEDKFYPQLDDAEEFTSQQEAQEQADYWNLYWQNHEHPPELTILDTFVTTPEQIKRIYQQLSNRWQAIERDLWQAIVSDLD